MSHPLANETVLESSHPIIESAPATPQLQEVLLSDLPFPNSSIQITDAKIVCTEYDKDKKPDDLQVVVIDRTYTDQRIDGTLIAGANTQNLRLSTNCENPDTKIEAVTIQDCNQVTIEPGTAISEITIRRCEVVVGGRTIQFNENSVEKGETYKPHQITLRRSSGRVVPITIMLPPGISVKHAQESLQEIENALPEFPITHEPTQVNYTKDKPWIYEKVEPDTIGRWLVTDCEIVDLGHIAGQITTSNIGEMVVQVLSPKESSRVEADIVRAGDIAARNLSIVAESVYAGEVDLGRYSNEPTEYCVNHTHCASDITFADHVHAHSPSRSMSIHSIQVGSGGSFNRYYGDCLDADFITFDNYWNVFGEVSPGAAVTVTGKPDCETRTIMLSKSNWSPDEQISWYQSWMTALTAGEKLSDSNSPLRVLWGSDNEIIYYEEFKQYGMSISDFVRRFSDAQLAEMYFAVMKLPKDSIVFGDPDASTYRKVDIRVELQKEWDRRNEQIEEKTGVPNWLTKMQYLLDHPEALAAFWDSLAT